MKHLDEIYNQLMTVRDWVRWGASLFNANALHFGHGTDNAWDEALCLVLHAIHLPPNSHPEIFNAHLTREEKKTISDLFQIRVEKRLPVPYITHEAWFAGLKFYIDQSVLIPRSSFTEIIEKQFEPWIDATPVHRVLDMCTGSACIAIATALVFSEAKVDAIDISEDALVVAKKNVSAFELSDRIQLIHSSLFNGLRGQRYDLILSNPPYVSAQEMALLPQEYRHEPRLGLFAEDEGLNIVIQILAQASDFLTEQGILMVEVGNSEKALTKRFPQVPFTWLEFENSEGGVFFLTYEQLIKYGHFFK
jgi:ribosomal protein L3 glutamine methyltransferase